MGRASTWGKGRRKGEELEDGRVGGVRRGRPGPVLGCTTIDEARRAFDPSYALSVRQNKVAHVHVHGHGHVSVSRWGLRCGGEAHCREDGKKGRTHGPEVGLRAELLPRCCQ